MKHCAYRILAACLCIAFLVLSDAASAQVVPDSYRRQKQQEYQQFKDSIHDEFVRYLEHLWTEYQLMTGEPSPRSIKPAEQPQIDTAENDDTLKIDRQVSFGELSTMDSSSQNRQQQVVDRQAPHTTIRTRNYTMPFYGRKLTVPLPEMVATAKLTGVRERQVARFWKKLAEERADLSVASLDQQRSNLYLSDWGMLDLIRHFAAAVFPDQPDEQAVFTVFLLSAMHYDARVGRMDDRLVMLVNTGSRIYDIPYVEIDSLRYYAFGNLPRKGRLHTYEQQLKDADQPVDMHLDYSPRIGGALSSRTFSCTLLGHDVTFRVNQPLMDFYACYPQTELPIYANAAIEEALAAAIERELRPFVEGETPVAALNNLLEFMQQGFKYQTDRKQFGREKNYFCEENFYYPANDCEDRAVLFARIVKILLGYEVVLLEYEDHVATAVCVPGRKIRGRYLEIQGKRYMVCDPTCLGATVGELGRKYRNKKANVIQLNR